MYTAQGSSAKEVVASKSRFMGWHTFLQIAFLESLSVVMCVHAWNTSCSKPYHYHNSRTMLVPQTVFYYTYPRPVCFILWIFWCACPTKSSLHRTWFCTSVPSFLQSGNPNLQHQTEWQFIGMVWGEGGGGLPWLMLKRKKSGVKEETLKANIPVDQKSMDLDALMTEMGMTTETLHKRSIRPILRQIHRMTPNCPKWHWTHQKVKTTPLMCF